MQVNKKIVLNFSNEIDEIYKLTLTDIKDGLTLAQVTDVANTIISDNVIYSKGGDLKVFKKAEEITTTIKELE